MSSERVRRWNRMEAQPWADPVPEELCSLEKPGSGRPSESLGGYG